MTRNRLSATISTTIFSAATVRAASTGAWKVGVGFPIDNMMVGVDAAIGMTDLLRTPMSFRENRVSVSFTYYL